MLDTFERGYETTRLYRGLHRLQSNRPGLMNTRTSSLSFYVARATQPQSTLLYINRRELLTLIETPL